MERYTKSFTTNTYLLIANLAGIGLFAWLVAYNAKAAIFGAKFLYATIAILLWVLTDRFLLTNVNTLDEIIGKYNYEEKRYEKPPNIAFGVMLFAIADLIGRAIGSL